VPVTKSGGTGGGARETPQDWTGCREQFAPRAGKPMASLASSLQAWCRERGIFAHHLTSEAALRGRETRNGVCGSDLKGTREREALQRELVRKDKALAEAAAR